jgi:hypothetical protein
LLVRLRPLPAEAGWPPETELSLVFFTPAIYFGPARASCLLALLGSRGETIITIGNPKKPRSQIRVDDICGDRAQFFAALAPALGIADRRQCRHWMRLLAPPCWTSNSDCQMLVPELPKMAAAGTTSGYIRYATKMNSFDQEEFFDQLAAANGQLAGDFAHLRALGAGLFRTRQIIRRAVAAYEQSKELLAQIERWERKLRRG